jgi:hypothetical protein
MVYKKSFTVKSRESVRRCEECVIQEVVQNAALNGAKKKHITLITEGWVDGVVF